MTSRRRCAIPGLLNRIAIVERRTPERFPEQCEDQAARLIEVTRVSRDHLTALRAEVCLWHSLIAVEQLGARLIRVLDDAPAST